MGFSPTHFHDEPKYQMDGVTQMDANGWCQVFYFGMLVFLDHAFCITIQADVSMTSG
jgi:hypothetical protein